MFEKGQFVGEDDIIEGNTLRSYSAISKSADLVIFFIQKDVSDFNLCHLLKLF